MDTKVLNEINQMKYLFGYRPGKVISEQSESKNENVKWNKIAGEILTNIMAKTPFFVSPLFPGAVITDYLNYGNEGPLQLGKNSATIHFKIFLYINQPKTLIERRDMYITFRETGVNVPFQTDSTDKPEGSIDFRTLDIQKLFELYKSGKLSTSVGEGLVKEVGMSNPLYFMSGSDKQTNDSVISAFNALNKINPEAKNLIYNDYEKQRDMEKIKWFQSLVNSKTNSQPAQQTTKLNQKTTQTK